MSAWVLLAEGFGAGRMPVAPGTAGSVVGVGVFLVLLATGHLGLYLAGTLVLIAVAVPACGEAERVLGRRDPPSVVLDEIVAMPLCYAGWIGQGVVEGRGLPGWGDVVSSSGVMVVGAGFVLFRVFDIWKPGPIRRSQGLPGGWGVVADDVLAALAVNGCYAAWWWLAGAVRSPL